MASAKATVQSFEQAEEFLAGGRNKTSRPLANNTYVERRTEDRIAIRLHSTDVVEFTRSGLIFLNTGGWRTVTTKDRINMALPWPVGVFSNRGVWRVKTTPGWEGEWSVPFAEGIALRQINGTWEPIAGTFPSASEEEKIATARKSLEKAIKRYLAKADEVLPQWTAELKEQGKLNPAGDPWCCAMGVGAQDNDHLWTHLKEQYVFPTIFKHALEDSGKFRDPIQRLLLDIQMGWYDALKRELRKYLLKRLDPAQSVRSQAEQAAKFVEYAEDVLVKPEDFGYWGNDQSLWITSAPTFTRTRDSDNITLANFDIVWETLKAEFPDLFLDTDDPKTENPGGIYVIGFGHWAVGHTDQIVVPVLNHPGLVTGDNLHPAFIRVCELAEQTKMYPALPGAEERAAKADVEDENKDIQTWLNYLGFAEKTTVADVRRLLGEAGTNYDWSSDQIRRLVIEDAEESAHNENNAALPGQGVLL